jgi:serine/threonine protein kinase
MMTPIGLRPFRRGGNGELFLGRWGATGATVVIKYLRNFGNPRARDVFANEVRVLLRGYVGVVPVLSWDLGGERPYYVMPYLECGNLMAWAGRLNDAQTTAIAETVARTLSAMHANGDLDGDLKPENLLIDGAGKIWLADPIGNAAPPISWVKPCHGGTPGYRAPEVRAGFPISSSADVYSFGAMLYHLLTGNAPVECQRLDTIIQGFWMNDVLRGVITTCCNPDPSERPTMTEVLQLLSGKEWAIVRAERVQRQVVGAVLLIAVALAIAAPLLMQRDNS